MSVTRTLSSQTFIRFTFYFFACFFAFFDAHNNFHKNVQRRAKATSQVCKLEREHQPDKWKGVEAEKKGLSRYHSVI